MAPNCYMKQAIVLIIFMKIHIIGQMLHSKKVFITSEIMSLVI